MKAKKKGFHLKESIENILTKYKKKKKKYNCFKI